MRALVLGSGGNRGALQAGALQELLRHGVRFDVIVGSSVGALNGAYLAADPSPQRAQLVALWRHMPGRRVFPGSRPSVAARVLGRAVSLYPNDGLRMLLTEQLPYVLLEEAAVRLIVVATDLGTGRERRLHTGPVMDAVLASAAIPGIYPPVSWDDALLVDGGVVAGVPVAAAMEAGADELWVLDTGQPCTAVRRPRTALDVAAQAMAFAGDAHNRLAIAGAADCARVHHLALACADDRWFSDFTASAELIEQGRSAARMFLQTRPVPT